MTEQAEPRPKGWLPKAEYHAIYSRVPRATVEVVIADHRGVLLSLRDIEPCFGMWHLPGGTVLFGETLLETVARVARAELGIAVRAGEMLGAIEYPSHYEAGTDHPIGIAFACQPVEPLPDELELVSQCEWCAQPPDPIHPEQLDFITQHGLWRPALDENPLHRA